MLRWRLILGILIIAALAGLCWLDITAAVPGTWLMPVAVIFTYFASAETVQLMAAAGLKPRAGVVYRGNILIVLASWLPMLQIPVPIWWDSRAAYVMSWQTAVAYAAWPAMALTFCIIDLFIAEMWFFQKPGRTISNLSASALALVYVGMLMSFLVQLRLVFGVGALVSLIIVVKCGDTGAYFVGRLFGRHKMSPSISPGKTWEGAAGAIFFACIGALVCSPLLPSLTNLKGYIWEFYLSISYGIVLAVAGMLGDLAESLLKRDAGRKDSSTWMPGFGGVLDVMDSLLFAAPVGWIFWVILSSVR
jgi:phosphatidate cytidylyltransferase